MESIKNFFLKVFEFIKRGNNRYIILSIISLIVYIITFYLLIGKSQEFHIYSVVTNAIFLISIIAISLFIVVRYDGTETLKTRFGRSIIYSIYVILGIVFLYFAISFLSGADYVSDFISYLIQGFLILGFLYLTYSLIKNTQIVNKLRENPYFNAIFNFIFAIPRYIYEGSLFMYKDVKNTPGYVFKILLTLIISITLWFVIPYIKKLLYTHNSILLLDKPIYTSYEKTLNMEDIHKLNLKNNKNKNKYFNISKQEKEINKEYNYRYGLSCWIFIDNQGENMSYTSNNMTPLFRYGKNPIIEYNSSKNELQITSQQGLDGIDVIYSSKNIPLQKWNNFIINYDGGKIDIFLNGKLVATKSSVIPYSRMDTIITGNEDGVKGGISNVMYFPEPLSKVKIDWLYNTFKNSKRPTF
tara:strand:+ start:244 stop:1482 length:1239 start_codon:yes stop_codon:yes gene_type:complete